MPLHQNLKKLSLSQSLVSLLRLKAVTKQLGREQETESERDWGCGCYSNHVVGLNCSSLAFISSFWAYVSLPLSSSTLTFVYPSLFLLLSRLSISLISPSPSRAALSLSSDLPACRPPSFPSPALLSFLGKEWETVFNVNAEWSFNLCLFGCLSIFLTLSWHSHLLSLDSYYFQTRTIDEDSAHSERIWVDFWRWVKAVMISK